MTLPCSVVMCWQSASGQTESLGTVADKVKLLKQAPNSSGKFSVRSAPDFHFDEIHPQHGRYLNGMFHIVSVAVELFPPIFSNLRVFESILAEGRCRFRFRFRSTADRKSVV